LKLDERLKHYINEKAELQKNKKLNITHLEIATDLNSSRVVISRLLKKMEKDGLLLLGRNTIQILN